MSSSHKRLDAVVLGAGVIGLSCAIELAKKGIKVAVVARDLPEDIHSTSFSSPWAGASFAPWAENEVQLSHEERTFKRMSKLAETHPDLVKVTKYRYGWNSSEVKFEPLSSRWLPEWRKLSPDECPRGNKFGIGFTSLTINPPAYTLYLLDTLKTLEVPIVRHRVSSIYEAFDLPPDSNLPGKRVDLVVNATGLGALSLLGVSDPQVYPAKGQTITLRAPQVTECISSKEPRAGGQQLYIIPQPGGKGLVTIGGCFLKGDWSTNVVPETAERILQEGFELCPELALREGEGKEALDNKSWEDIEVVSHNVGLRPCRQGGIRIELEEGTLPTSKHSREADRDEMLLGILPEFGQRIIASESGESGRGRMIKCVHAYGIGGAG